MLFGSIVRSVNRTANSFGARIGGEIARRELAKLPLGDPFSRSFPRSALPPVMVSPVGEPLPKLCRRPWLTLLAWAFCLEGLFLAFYVAPVSFSLDFYHINFVPPAVRSGLNVYDVEDHSAIVNSIIESSQSDPSERLQRCVGANRRLYETGFCPTATPFLYTLHSLGLIGPFVARFWMFHVAATIVCLCGLYWTARSAGLRPQVSWLLSGLTMSFCWGLLLDAELANVTRFQLFGLSLAMMASITRKSWGMIAAGFVLAVGAAYKPTVLPALVFWLAVLAIDHGWRQLSKGLIGLLAGAAASFLFPLILFGSLGCWSEWQRFAGTELAALAVSFPGNYSLQTALAAGGMPGIGFLPHLIGAAILFAFWKTRCSAGNGSQHDVQRHQRLCLAIALGPLWTILASPLTWVQYSALSMPVAIVLIAVAASAPRSKPAWIAVIAIAGGLAGGVAQRFIRVDAIWLDCLLLWIGWLGLALLSIRAIAVSRWVGSNRFTAGGDSAVLSILPRWLRRSADGCV